MGYTSSYNMDIERRCQFAWKSVSPMEEKIRFIENYMNGIFSFIELCERYEISRKTGYGFFLKPLVGAGIGIVTMNTLSSTQEIFIDRENIAETSKK